MKKTKIPAVKVQADGDAAFSEAMKDVRTIDRLKRRRIEKRRPKQLKHHNEDDAKRILEKTVTGDDPFNVANMPEYMEGHIEGINPVVMEKLRNGEFAIQKILDLHGCTLNEAKERFELFVREIIREGLNCVKVIHGRGLKSKRAPLLKENLKRWVVKAMHRKWVMAFSSATMPDGGPGATYILLRKRPEKKKIRIIG
ncbi:MAG TPA: Smr/MutS family protein [Syntrophorhabdaceae bacterium]|nr:Smr/MutS family protein [Syntrophorhabdaceae bacterium]HQM81232.1 Smr/MutS family protein [Syntrophorhabdaceae bacterium]